MGLTGKGILDGFSGLVGTVVGSRWRTLEVMRSRPKKSGKPPVQSQLDQQMKFKLIAELAADLQDVFAIGYKANNTVITPRNAAVSYHLANAITGVSPKFSVDYTKLKLSTGRLKGAEDPIVTVTAGLSIGVAWNELEGLLEATMDLRNTDQLMFVAYNVVKDSFLFNMGGKQRDTLIVNTRAPKIFAGGVTHIWIFFVAADGKSTSESQYLGTVVPIL